VGTSCAVFRFCVVLAWAAALVACGGSATGVELQGLDVTLVQTEQCTLTGQASRNCTDPAELGQTKTAARWFVSTNADDVTLTVTTDDGRTLAGVSFDNDGTSLNTPGCAGEGGECVFARRRFSTSDTNTGCQTFDELFVVGHFDVDDARVFAGEYTAVAGANEACGTATVNESIFAIAGTVVDEPVLAIEEAQ
jgi:hypothetical protein